MTLLLWLGAGLVGTGYLMLKVTDYAINKIAEADEEAKEKRRQEITKISRT